MWPQKLNRVNSNTRESKCSCANVNNLDSLWDCREQSPDATREFPATFATTKSAHVTAIKRVMNFQSKNGASATQGSLNPYEKWNILLLPKRRLESPYTGQISDSSLSHNKQELIRTSSEEPLEILW